MKKILLSIICLATLTLYSQTSIEPTSGDGTILNPYQISTLQNLYWITENNTRFNYHYVQTSNIDASETVNWFPDGIGGHYGWLPIGQDYVGDFTGSYDGNGHIIKGLFVNRTSENCQGLFGRTNGATISNLGLKNVEIHGQHTTGGLIGYNNNNSIVINCYSEGIVTGSWGVGGLVGDNSSSTINKCYTTGSVAGSPMIGGLVGVSQYSSSVSNSYSRCSVSGGLYEIGGLIGSIFYSATVSNCYSTGSVTGPDWYLGGLVGRNYDSPPVNNSFWDIQTSGMLTSAGGTGKTTSEMNSQLTYTDAGWDFTAVWEIIIINNNGYPVLRWQSLPPSPFPPSAGDGTIENPYQIATLENLYWIAVDNSRWNKNYIQTANIDASETAYWFSNVSGGYYGWTPIGNAWTNKFSGVYDGNGHIIDSLYINRPDVQFLGLFGVTSAATIKNLGVTNVNISGYLRIGAVVGCIDNNSVVKLCFSSGVIAGTSNFIGGVVGDNRYSILSDCYSRANVSGYWSMGGLVGENGWSSVNNCFSTGTAQGGANGGLIGYNYLTTVSNSFWDTETSGLTISDGGIGKTTAEMKTNTSFLNAGWDPHIWNIGDGINDGYAYLAWQNPGGTSIFQTPILHLPVNNSTGIRLNPTLIWSTISGANNYRLEVNTQPDFTGTVIFNADTLTDTSYTVNELLENSSYYWRVVALNDFGFSSDTSCIFLFTTKLATATLISPTNNSVGISLSPTLSWSTILGADNYRLEVNTQPDFAGTIVFDSDTISSILYQVGGLTNNTTYYWRVTGLNFEGNISDTSSTFWFTTQQTARIEAIFTITDDAGGTTVLIAGLDSLATDGLDPTFGEAQLTAVPPAGVFDARFNFLDSTISSLKDIRQGTFQEGFSKVHEMQFQVGAGTSIILNYDFGTYTADKVRARLQDVVTGELIDTTIYGSGSYIVSDPTMYNKLKLTIMYDTSIPVELTSFSASITDRKVNLKWSTSTETNNIGFSIERKSKNENYWNTVSFVNGRGTTTESTSYVYTDKNVPGGIYNYRLKQIDFNGNYEYSNSIEVEVSTPKQFALAQNFPNPFNPSTLISYEIPQQSNVLLKVFDILGNEVATIINEEKSPGNYQIRFDASNLSNGVYLYRLQAGNFIETKKMILIK